VLRALPEDLGYFVEIEAIDADGTIGRERLETQCADFMMLLGVGPPDLLEPSYSDMLLTAAEIA